MPTYQYRCTACSKELEAVQKFSDPALTTCPACSGDLRKVYSAVGVVFKGSGFYATDSRTSSSASTPASTPETKKESTPTPAKAPESTTTAS
ncbi:FmdB family zinc ribbon protein [Arachnia propionica]|uniref:FmdB family zinc ribbon protein n=1 Tax=Arachnia propionica TaxID=1750 RepID=UPI0030D512B3